MILLLAFFLQLVLIIVIADLIFSVSVLSFESLGKSSSKSSLIFDKIIIDYLQFLSWIIGNKFTKCYLPQLLNVTWLPPSR